MLSLGHKLSKKYATNGIIDSEYIDSYAYIFDYIFNFALYNFTLILIGFILHKSAITITYVIITGYLRAVAGGYHCKRHITCTILSYTVFALYISLNTIVSTIPYIYFIINICNQLGTHINNFTCWHTEQTFYWYYEKSSQTKSSYSVYWWFCLYIFLIFATLE